MKNEKQDVAVVDDVSVDEIAEDTTTFQLPILETKPIESRISVNPTLITHALSGEDWDFAAPKSEVQLRIQKQLTLRGLYKGKENGKWGNLSAYAINEYFGRVQAEPDSVLCGLIQDYAKEYGQTIKKVNFLDSATWEAFAEGLERVNNH